MLTCKTMLLLHEFPWMKLAISVTTLHDELRRIYQYSDHRFSMDSQPWVWLLQPLIIWSCVTNSCGGEQSGMCLSSQNPSLCLSSDFASDQAKLVSERTWITAYSLPVSCNHHCSDVIWAFRSFTRYSSFLLQFLWTNNNEIIKALHYWLFVRGIHRQEFGRLFHDMTACYVCVNQYYEFNYLFDVYVSYFLFCFSFILVILSLITEWLPFVLFLLLHSRV